MGTKRTDDRRPLRLFLAAWLVAIAALWGEALLAAPTTAVSATTLVVTTTEDSDDGTCDDHCSLREAITAAGDSAGQDTITFDLPANSTITLGDGLGGSQLPSIDHDLTIDGSTTSNLTLSGDHESRVFRIRNGAVVTLTALIISNGEIATTGGAIYSSYSTVSINDTTFQGNSAGFGGAIYNVAGDLTFNNTTFAGNEAEASGGAIGSVASTGSASLIINDSTFDDNTAERGGAIYNSGDVELYESTLSSNEATLSGGGIYSTGDLIIRESTFDDNTAYQSGGGIFNEGAAVVDFTTFKDNTAETEEGGGIKNYRATLTVGNSLFHHNMAQAEEGGGIENTGVATIENSTFSANGAATDGGGIYTTDTLTIHNSTFTGNEAGTGGGIYNWITGILYVSNTIIAGSPGDDCFNETGTIVTNQNNLVEDNSCPEEASGRVTGDPLLGSLADNGGATLTHAPSADSPAIDAGDNASCLPADQRGAARPADGNGDDLAVCDIGAFELDRPVARDDDGSGFSGTEDAPFATANVLANDRDPLPNDALAIVAFDVSATAGLVSDNGDGTFTYDPNGRFEELAAGEAEVDTFHYTIQDSIGLTDTAAVSVIVVGVNDAPRLSGVSVTSPDDVSQPAVLTATITEIDASDTMTATVTWGDGTADSFTYNAGTIDFNEAHVYPGAGHYILTVEVVDGSGSRDQVTLAALLGKTIHLPVIVENFQP